MGPSTNDSSGTKHGRRPGVKASCNARPSEDTPWTQTRRAARVGTDSAGRAGRREPYFVPLLPFEVFVELGPTVPFPGSEKSDPAGTHPLINTLGRQSKPSAL